MTVLLLRDPVVVALCDSDCELIIHSIYLVDTAIGLIIYILNTVKY